MSNIMKQLATLLTLMVLMSLSLHAQKLSAYYDAPFADAKKVTSNLKKAGFEVLATHAPASAKHLHVIIFTNKALTTLASKKSRGFASVQRVMIDSQNKTVRATNPSYWLKAFMQKDFKAGSDTQITASLTKALGKLTPTSDALDAKDLSGYHFMIGMPYYEDMIELKTKPKKSLFELKLANGSTLVGVSMGKATESFIDKIGADKALLLPYTVLIEEGKGYALHPKYYIALSYPLLSMGQFMDISSTPDAIERKLKKNFK
jgi:hypothetical protein